MTWHVRYEQNGVKHLERYPTPEAAIEAACQMIDDGLDVFAIGTGPLNDSVEREEIARIYLLWARAKAPFGPLPCRCCGRYCGRRSLVPHFSPCTQVSPAGVVVPMTRV